MIELALQYAARGWPVFPLVPGGKVPLKGSHGCKDATTDPACLEQLWREPDCNVGIATGRVSGLFVLDVDTKDGRPGIESLRSLSLPETFTVRTPTGGFHLYFDLPRGAACSIGADLLPGLDWRADGGYVVAAGSVTDRGTYLIARKRPIVPLPADLLARAQRAGREYTIRRDESGEMILLAGSRDNDLYRIGCALRNFGVSEAAILGALRSVSEEHCRPPHPDHDLQRIAHSCTRHAPKHRSVA